MSAPELIIGHGVLGRLLARLTVAAGLPPPTVWELDAAAPATARTATKSSTPMPTRGATTAASTT